MGYDRTWRGTPRGGNRGQFQKQIVQNWQKRNNFFSNSEINYRSSLKDSEVNAPTTNAFKNRLTMFKKNPESTPFNLNVLQNKECNLFLKNLQSYWKISFNLSYAAYPASYKNCGTWVVLPEPVSPQMMTMSLSWIFSMIICSSVMIGSFDLDSFLSGEELPL